jgi:transposase
MRERGIEVPKRRLLTPVTQPMPATAPEFVPVPIAPAAPVLGDIRIEIRRGNSAIKVDWPVQASGDCAAWLRDWLR